MAENSRSIVVFYDAPCIDGAGAAWSFEKKYGGDTTVNLELVPLGHGAPDAREQKILMSVNAGDEVYFVDTSPKDGELTKLLSPVEGDGDELKPRVKSVTVWDHHETEKERVEQFQGPKIEGYSPPAFEAEVDTEMPSAALMAWKKLFGDDLAPEVFSYIGKMEPPVSLQNTKDRAIAAALDAMSIKDPQSIVATFNEATGMDLDDLVNRGNAIQADQLNNTDKMRATITYTRLQLLEGRSEMWVPISNANVQYFGRGIDRALIDEGNLSTNVGVSGSWYVKDDTSVALSLRSNGKPDVGKIAKHLGKTIGVGGGGHSTSAVVQFRDLAQFSKNVPIYTHAEMRDLQWADQPDEKPVPAQA